MAIFEKEEIEERLLSLMKEIRNSTVAVKKIVDNHGSPWSNLRGELFNLLTSLRKLQDLLGYFPDFEQITESAQPGKPKLDETIGRLVLKVEELAKEDVDPKFFEFPYEVEMGIMETCSSLTETMDYYTPIVEKQLNRSFGSSLTLIHDLISSSGGRFNGNWAIAVVYLSAMEITVNRRRAEYGLVKPEEDVSAKGFQQTYPELRKYLLEKNIDIESGVHTKVDLLMNVRNQILYGGMEVDDDSLNMIIKWSLAVIGALSEPGK